MDTKFVLKSSDEFPLPSGQVLKLKPVSIARIRAAQSRAEKILREKGMRITPPERIVEGVNVAPGVDPVTAPYDDTTIQGAPDEIKAQYDEYKVNKQLLTKTTVGLMTSTLLLRGVVIEVPDNGWQDAQRTDGMEVPTLPEELYVHYLTTEVLLPPVLVQECVMRVLYLSLEGIDPEALKAFEDAFHSGTQRRGDAAGDTSKAAQGQLEV